VYQSGKEGGGTARSGDPHRDPGISASTSAQLRITNHEIRNPKSETRTPNPESRNLGAGRPGVGVTCLMVLLVLFSMRTNRTFSSAQVQLVLVSILFVEL
jgi:hypothetical protein